MRHSCRRQQCRQLVHLWCARGRSACPVECGAARRAVPRRAPAVSGPRSERAGRAERLCKSKPDPILMAGRACAFLFVANDSVVCISNVRPKESHRTNSSINGPPWLPGPFAGPRAAQAISRCRPSTRPPQWTQTRCDLCTQQPRSAIASQLCVCPCAPFP